MSDELMAELAVVVDEVVRQGAPDPAALLVEMAECVGRMFTVKPYEVAILSITEDGDMLGFLLPEELRKVGQIPVEMITSLAARTARENRAEIFNDFLEVPHASVFEGVPLAQKPGKPIQKIMSAPISLNGKVIGVIQVSRKAQQANSAGPDFTGQELQQLLGVADILAPCIPYCTKAST